jgi:hypothetical protein
VNLVYSGFAALPVVGATREHFRWPITNDDDIMPIVE